MYVNEIFYSIEGEGKTFGIPTVFVRLQGCNLNPGCSWCDTKYARSAAESNKEQMPIKEILAQVQALAPRIKRAHVCLTGGEPLYQKATGRLVTALVKAGYYIEMFTNGTLPPPGWYRRIDSFVVDIKCPSSGINFYDERWFYMRAEDQIKFVVADKVDLVFATSILQGRVYHPDILISPMIPVRSNFAPTIGPDELNWAHKVVEYCKEYGYRFSWQQQKLLYGDKRGV